METLECIETRRSIRKFTDKPVGKPVIVKLVASAQLAPSWKNTQTARYTAVTDKAVLSEICENLGERNRNIVSSAPLLMAVSCVMKQSAYEPDGTPSSVYGDAYTYFDCGAAVENLCLTANDMGLATVVLGTFDPNKLTPILNIPEDENLFVLVACGYSTETPPQPRKKPLEDILRII